MRIVILAFAVTLSVAASASAQHAPATPPIAPAPQDSGFAIEAVNTPFVVAPAYKVTRVDGQTAQLAGVYAGRMLDDQILIGGAVYTLTNLSRGTDLTYGGLLVGWMSSSGRRVRFGGRALAGVGEGALPTTVVRFGHGRPQAPPPVPQSTSVSVQVRDGFAVLEPEADVSARLTDHVTVGFAAGYRLTGATDLLRDRLNGMTGALALQFGW
jgi:hypothetical protein